LQQAALGASDALERAHEIYHEPGVNPQEISRSFAALDTGIVRLKNERQREKTAAKFITSKPSLSAIWRKCSGAADNHKTTREFLRR
jgi:hypothetical protein